jgi:flagellar motor switch protein FliN/FliY
LGPGSILEVGKTVDEPVELLVNNRLVARGDVVVVDEKFGLRITEIVSREERIESLR